MIQADSTDTTIPPAEKLFVALWHDGEITDSAICADPDAALTAAMEMLDRQPGLFDGDAVMVITVKQPTLTERNLG